MPNVIKHETNNFVTVSYAVREVTIEITHAEHALILALSAQKVQMIKFIRAQYNLGLYEAKQVVDTVIAAAEGEVTKTTESDWGTLPRGGLILVRDSEADRWEKRVFITYDEGKFYRYVCESELGGTVSFKYAKLITD